MKNLPARWAALAFIALALTACMSQSQQDNEAQAVVEGSGYTQVEMTGFKWIGCGEEDHYQRGFNAVSATGKNVQGVVCGGYSKGWTVRIRRVL